MGSFPNDSDVEVGLTKNQGPPLGARPWHMTVPFFVRNKNRHEAQLLRSLSKG